MNAASDINVVANKYANLEAALVGTDEVPVGVTTRAMTAAYYGWLQTKGVALCALNASTTCAIGDIVVLAAVNNTGEAGSVATLGQFTTSTEVAQLTTEPLIGVCIQTVTSAAGVEQVFVAVDLMLE